MEEYQIQQINQIWEQVHQNKLTFPETVQALLKCDVERYHVDYVSQQITAYGKGNTVYAASVELEAVSGEPLFNGDEIKQSIKQVQADAITYSTFSQKIIQAGVTDYWTYIAGKRVIYSDRFGDSHIEWFPGAKKD